DVVRVAVGVLPLRRALPGEEWLKGGRDRCYSDTRRPRTLAIHVDVQLRYVAIVARVRLGDPWHILDRLEHLVRRDLETRLLGTLYVHRDRLTTSAEDRRRVLNCGRDSGNLLELAAKPVLDVLHRRRTMRCGLETDVDRTGVGRAAKSGSDCRVGEFRLRLLSQEFRNLLGLVGRVT